jgi:hypothetical protein
MVVVVVVVVEGGGEGGRRLLGVGALRLSVPLPLPPSSICSLLLMSR